jgi:hypothetical protein
MTADGQSTDVYARAVFSDACVDLSSGLKLKTGSSMTTSFYFIF